MSVPQMKEGPASMLRAMFAGFGSLLSVIDKVRAKPAAEAPADAEAPAAPTAQAPEETAAPQDTAPSEAAAAPEAVVAAEPETSAAPQATAEPQAIAEPETSAATETVAAEPAAEPETSPAPEASSALPLANYDELSVASLRARLRNLSNDDLTGLMTYEKAHQDRPEVIKMFQNRLIKMTTGLPKLEA
jgi:hypothetical protein